MEVRASFTLDIDDVIDFDEEDVYCLYRSLNDEQRQRFWGHVYKGKTFMRKFYEFLRDVGNEEAREILLELLSEFPSIEECKERNRKFYEEAK
ncbi:hypothetical protein B6S12_09775 [Helicobacter valdiviensis]|uniref:Uncharacterized protein n=1 Tax=Helicobacter valdiviensis TaxID=1458358 RepID=A0A2W6MS67_9HELI|nr:hypothetical protein [Helicobacter valdiviensis]PZT47312.1 hypothetical protein B6S12_09775 [Helicobacter valdiviensis]